MHQFLKPKSKDFGFFSRKLHEIVREQGFYALQASAEVRGGLPAFMPEYDKTSGIRSNRCGFRLFAVLSFISRLWFCARSCRFISDSEYRS